MGLFDLFRKKPELPEDQRISADYAMRLETTRVAYAAIAVEAATDDVRASKLGGVPYRPQRGRYDALLAQFGRDEPAVGFSLSLDWLAGALAARGLDAPRRAAPARERLAARESLAELFAEAHRLRAEGRRIEIVPGGDRR